MCTYDYPRVGSGIAQIGVVALSKQKHFNGLDLAIA